MTLYYYKNVCSDVGPLDRFSGLGLFKRPVPAWAEQVLTMKFSVQILVNPKGGFTAVCLSLPGCAARADTRELAKKKLEDAVKGYLAAVGNFVPENLAGQLVEA